MPATQTRQKKVIDDYKVKQPERKPNYVYPHPPPAEMNRYQRSSSREDNGSPKSSAEEEEVKPVLTKPVPIEKRFKDVFKISDYADERRKYSSDEDRIVTDNRRPPAKYNPPQIEEFKESYKKQPMKVSKYSRELEYRAGNKTDKQKYKELTEQRYSSDSPRRYNDYRPGEPEDFDRIYRAPVERTKSLKRYDRCEVDESPPSRYRNRSIEPTRYRDQSPEDYRYKQPESMPYPGQKVPYSSYDEQRFNGGFDRAVDRRWNRGTAERRPNEPDFYRDDHRVIVHRAEVVRHKAMETPDSTLQKTSPRDRFQNAKEKFQAMERDRPRKSVEPAKPSRKSVERPYEQNHGGWSSDEEFQMRKNYRELPTSERYPGLDRDSVGRLLPSKSLGNLVQGYRHSYAEPRHFPRSGRVGLAPVNPY